MLRILPYFRENNTISTLTKIQTCRASLEGLFFKDSILAWKNSMEAFGRYFANGTIVRCWGHE